MAEYDCLVIGGGHNGLVAAALASACRASGAEIRREAEVVRVTVRRGADAGVVLADGTWDEKRDALADRCLDLFARYAPNVKDRALHRQMITPPDMERSYGLTGGNIMQGAMGLDQLGPLRLACRTPLPGLYLCKAATHPGGGVIGACGLNAARTILRA